MELPKDLKDEIWEYCRLNDITDLNAFMVRMLKQGYNTEKYGATPFKIGQKETEIVEKIIEKEVIKEIPIEVIKEIIIEKEVIKEVPIEIEKIVEIIKEVPVEIIVEKTNGNSEKLVEKEVIVEKRVEIPVEVIREVEKIVEVPVEKIVEVLIKDDEQIKKLERKIEILEAELELEKNRNYEPKKTEQPKEEKPKGLLNNVISWVSKSERDTDLYNE